MFERSSRHIRSFLIMAAFYRYFVPTMPVFSLRLSASDI